LDPNALCWLDEFDSGVSFQTFTGARSICVMLLCRTEFCVSVIPIDCDSAPIRPDNCALIGGACFPANSVANFEKSGLVAGHLRFALGGSTRSTRFISLWPEKL
jgi:hypothetical protein